MFSSDFGAGSHHLPFPVGDRPLHLPPRPSGVRHPQSLVWHRSPSEIAAFDQAIQRLYLSIDYRSINAIPPPKLNKNDVLADGLAYIHLRNGSGMNRRRSLDTGDVVRQLTDLIPGPHFLAVGVPASVLHLLPKRGVTPSHLQLLKAAASYVREMVDNSIGSRPQALQNNEASTTATPGAQEVFEAAEIKGESLPAADNQEVRQLQTGQDT